MTTLHTRMTPDDIQRAISLAVLAMRGAGNSDIAPLVDGFKLRIGMGMLSNIYQAFLVKAKGGTDAAGIKWKELSKKYIAYGRRHPGLNEKRAKAKAEGRPGRPLLSPAHDKLWRSIYARCLAKFQADGEPNPEGHAAAAAWLQVKAEGGATIYDTYSNTPVEIGRNTGRLGNAMAVGLTGASVDLDMRLEPGAVMIVIKVSYAAHFHAKRPLWDSSKPLPQEWRQTIDDLTSSFIAQAIPRLLTR